VNCTSRTRTRNAVEAHAAGTLQLTHERTHVDVGLLDDERLGQHLAVCEVAHQRRLLQTQPETSRVAQRVRNVAEAARRLVEVLPPGETRQACRRGSRVTARRNDLPWVGALSK
jgi:hypothetical protein